AAMFWHTIALLELTLHTASGAEFYQGSVVFRCEGETGPVEVSAPVRYSVLEVAGQLLALCLLSGSLYLGSRAQWLTCLEVEAGALRETLDSSRICPRNQHPVLTRVYGKQLMDLRVGKGQGSLPLDRPKSWPEDSTVVMAAFGQYREAPSPQVRRRQYLLTIGGLGIVLLHGSSTSCWGCINEVVLGSTGGLFDVEAQLLLLGSCGRHNGSGIPCLLAGFCLTMLLFCQAVILLSGASDSAQDDDQMAITLVDAREYQENLIYGLYAGQEVRSHVWLRPNGSYWEVADFTAQDGRSSWRRSQAVVSGVRIIHELDAQWSSVHSRGLPTEEGPCSVCVQFTSEGKEVRQMVPVDFLPGAFFCSVSVGRRQAWSNLSMIASAAAMALIVFDLSFHVQYIIQGTLLKDCEDIISGRCLELEPRDRITVRSAMGAYLAILGAICVAAIICILVSLK
ncbi:unnamed protein product, partial [Effrenium voratum]